MQYAKFYNNLSKHGGNFFFLNNDIMHGKPSVELFFSSYEQRTYAHKPDGIGVRRIRTFPFLPIPFTTPSLMIQWKLDCRSRKQKRKNQPIARPRIEHRHWFIFQLLLATLTMQFSLDRKRRSPKQNQRSASDSVGLIFFRSYCPTLNSDYDSDYDTVTGENQP